MPPKKKKQPKNAFYFFMMDWKAEKEDQGQRFSGLREVADLCADDWKNLPQRNAEHYKKLEKEAKSKDKTDLSNKFNAHGITFQQLENEKREKEAAIERMNNEIHGTLMSASSSVDSLKAQCFYLVHTNIYCYWGSEQVYIPCEVAISKFNLQDGLVDSYHVFPAPFTKNGDIPLGYKYEVCKNAESVHGIPEPSEFDRSEYDWNKIRKDLRNFLVPSGTSEIPPLYTMPGDDPNINCYTTAVKNFFDFVANDSNDEYRVYNLPLLFFKLYEQCQEFAVKLYADTERAFPYEGVAHQELLKDVYNFNQGIACLFHGETDHYYNCSLSFVKRWVFLICEFCCKALRMELIPGRHCLINAKITPSVAQAPPRLQPLPTQPVSRNNARDDDNDHSWSTVGKGVKNMSLGNPSRGAWGAASSSRGQPSTSAWGNVSREQQRGRDARMESSQANDIVVIDHSKVVDESEARVLKTGQSPNAVSENRPDSVRRPTTYGRGELLARALRAQQSPGASLSSDDFPAIGAERPGRLAKPMTSGWGRGFLNNE